jgi:DNA-binding response OmpR family regulator
MQDHKVLIVSDEPLIAALLGALIELEGFRPIFPSGEERVSETLERERPSVLIVDVDHPDGASRGVLARARLAGIAVIFFSPRRHGEEVHVIAEQCGVAWFPMPVERSSFVEMLNAAVRSP